MSDVLIKHLVLTLDKRLAVFTAKASSSDFLNDETSLRTAAYMISEIIMPCCCMLCNKAKLTEILKQTKLCHASSDFLNDETSLRTAAYMISEIIMPCCCMLCNKAKLTEILKQTKLCHGQPILTKTIVDLVYNDLARYNGLG